MKKRFFLIFLSIFGLTLLGCKKKETSMEYNMDDLSFITYSDIDYIMEKDDLIAEGKKILKSQSENLLMSYVMDSAIKLTKEELGEYDHLVYTNPKWIEQFADPDQLKSVDYNSLSTEMKEFL
ncbi:MAG: hypothetical protein KHY79_04535 [Clostridiales bacterium]|nr:hypothetical protein [Clostridiales bacterium]